MVNSSDTFPSPYGEDYWIFSEIVFVILILISCYFLVCLVAYVWKIRKDRKQNNLRLQLSLNILAVVMALGRLISNQIIAFLGWQTTNYCLSSITASLVFYSATVCPVYVLLWMRQHSLNSNKQLQSAEKRKKFVYLSYICLFLLVIGWIIISVVQVIPEVTGWKYEATSEGCRDTNDEAGFEIIPMLGNVLGVSGQVFLLSLLLYPLLKWKKTQKELFRSRQASEVSVTNEPHPETSAPNRQVAPNREAMTPFIVDSRTTTCKLYQ